MLLGTRGCATAFFLLMLGTSVVRAQDTGVAAEGDAQLRQARESYLEGVSLVQSARWAEALSRFEQSASLRVHATTLFNIGACERALGRYTRSRAWLLRALERGETNPDELPENLGAEARAFVEQIERLLVRIEVTLEPIDAAIAVDGRRLEADRFSADPHVLVAGTGEPGPGTPLLQARFELIADPGAHVLTLSRKGFGDAVVNRTFLPGARTALRLELARLPATLHVASDRDGAIVTVGDSDVGPVPADVLRPGGVYSVVVRKPGYVPYEANVTLRAGEELNLTARLAPETVPVTKRWWFWTGAAVVVGGGIALTYALTRPEPQPPPYDGGNRNWVVFTQGVHY